VCSQSGLVISLSSVCTPLSLPSASGLAFYFDLRLFSIGLDWRSLQSGLTTVSAIDLRVASLESLLSPGLAIWTPTLDSLSGLALYTRSLDSLYGIALWTRSLYSLSGLGL
jgi:hypothetical protein